MISFIHGELVEIIDSNVVVECGGVGYNIEVPTSVLSKLPHIGSEVKIYTYLNVTEDSMKLCGFDSREMLNIFKILISVSGIGPKGALSILSALSVNDLKYAIISEDAKAISKAPGVGLKTAQKLIIEAKGRIDVSDITDNAISGAAASLPEASSDDPRAEAIAALTALGYSNSEAVMAVRKVAYTEGMDSEAILKASLRNLSFL
jgi:Holliday junction DNA helicase RuvA